MADVIGQRVSGNLVYIDKSVHRRRVIDAIGPDVIKLHEDFVQGPVTGESSERMTATLVEAGAGESTVAVITADGGQGGILRFTADANENDGVNVQLASAAFKLVAGNVLHFHARVKLSEATQSDFFVGLAITDTDILGGVTDRIGFQKLDGSTDITAMLEKDSTETLTSALATAGTGWVELEFYLDASGGVEFFVDGASVATPAVTNLPNDEALRATVQFLSGAAGASKTFDVDFIRVTQIGGRAA